MALYVLVGAIGLPVFSAGASGLAELFGFTGGDLAAFILAGAVVGWLAERRWDRSPLGMLGHAIGTVLNHCGWSSRACARPPPDP